MPARFPATPSRSVHNRLLLVVFGSRGDPSPLTGWSSSKRVVERRNPTLKTSLDGRNRNRLSPRGVGIGPDL